MHQNFKRLALNQLITTSLFLSDIKKRRKHKETNKHRDHEIEVISRNFFQIRLASELSFCVSPRVSLPLSHLTFQRSVKYNFLLSLRVLVSNSNLSAKTSVERLYRLSHPARHVNVTPVQSLIYHLLYPASLVGITPRTGAPYIRFSVKYNEV